MISLTSSTSSPTVSSVVDPSTERSQDYEEVKSMKTLLPPPDATPRPPPVSISFVDHGY